MVDSGMKMRMLKSKVVPLLWASVVLLLLIDILVHRYSPCHSNVVHQEKEDPDSHPKHIVPSLPSDNCLPNVPCQYSDKVDLRIIVLTYKRKSSLCKLLDSLASLEMDGATAALEIWIDRSKAGIIDEDTVEAVQDFHWELGPKRVHAQKQHVGIYGQWIDSWRPPHDSQEIALILEDDMSVSRYAWRWLKAAHGHFGSRSDIHGYTLQSHHINKAIGSGPIQGPPGDVAWLNRQMGSWGFSPHPKVWAEFQDWFHGVYNDKDFHPYVGGGVVFDLWYKNFEKKGTTDSMWTIWFIHYTNKRNLYCVYNNLNTYLGGQYYLGANRQEPGLHFGGKGTDNTDMLLKKWDDSYVNFPKTMTKIDFDGSMKTD